MSRGGAENVEVQIQRHIRSFIMEGFIIMKVVINSNRNSTRIYISDSFSIVLSSESFKFHELFEYFFQKDYSNIHVFLLK